MTLSARQLEVLTFVRDEVAARGFSPTLKEIAQRMGIVHSRVHQHVERLTELGYLARNGKEWRSIRVLKFPETTDVASGQDGQGQANAQSPDILADARRAITCHRFRFSNEKDFQDGIAAALASHRIPFEREVRLAPGDVVDFLMDGFAFEVKIGGSLAALTRQLHRYAQHDRVKGLVAVSSRLRLTNLPLELNGKPVRTIAVPGGIL